ncbi:MAG: 3-hydroxybutyryl-CoA dehydrogenase [Syntrophomonadaceae bacterium]|jgi:3-hydroxybutyryl-CoA dehydrogenase|nr:3-hydroxybutyryl-CoA dehydrogenase [Syntrophomonadaceae bacterium]
MMENNLIAILGAGKMGAGIAQITAQSGYNVILRDLQLSVLQDGLKLIEENLDKYIGCQTLSVAQKEDILKHINITTDFSKVKNADIVIESVVENMAVKKQVFNELDNICSPDAILATNTSSLSISEIASSTKYKERIMGLHFHNPVPEFELVEIIKGFDTSDTVLEQAKEFVTSINKNYLLVEGESPGYVVNRMTYTFINEAISIFFEGSASVENIDDAMKLILKMPLGPLALADRIGLDSLHSALLTLYDEWKNPKYVPHRKFTTMVKAGHWGKKTGKGFYRYD